MGGCSSDEEPVLDQKLDEAVAGKVALLGDSGCGKTVLAQVCTTGEFVRTKITFLDFFSPVLEVDGKELVLHLVRCVKCLSPSHT
jgi:GTPase SAR1 family protein